MATASEPIRATELEPPPVRLADGPQPSCGECRFHIPHLTRPGGWCACDAAELRWKLVAAGRPVCRDFAVWPENGNASWRENGNAAWVLAARRRPPGTVF